MSCESSVAPHLPFEIEWRHASNHRIPLDEVKKCGTDALETVGEIVATAPLDDDVNDDVTPHPIDLDCVTADLSFEKSIME